MQDTTLEATKAIIRADPSVSPADRENILAAIRNIGKVPTTEKPYGPRLLRREEVAQRLGRAVRSVDLLARQGILKRVVLPGRHRGCGFREVDVMALINGEAA